MSVRICSLWEWSIPAAHRATCGGVWSVTYLELPPRAELRGIELYPGAPGERRLARGDTNCILVFLPALLPPPLCRRVRAEEAGIVTRVQ
jgi:hypothetical protein